MKGGSVSLILADAISYRAAKLSRGETAPSIPDAMGAAQEAMRLTYNEATSIAAVCEHAASAMRQPSSSRVAIE